MVISRAVIQTRKSAATTAGQNQGVDALTKHFVFTKSTLNYTSVNA